MLLPDSLDQYLKEKRIAADMMQQFGLRGGRQIGE
jgi:hypothetical protein